MLTCYVCTEQYRSLYRSAMKRENSKQYNTGLLVS